jgi:hypothetical protein
LNNELNEGTLKIFAAQNYYNPLGVDAEEFREDLQRLKYIKRLVNKFMDHGKLSERLILNHIIVFFNVFGIDASLKMLEFRMNQDQWTVIKPFLIFLKHIRNDQYTSINMNAVVINALREI